MDTTASLMVEFTADTRDFDKGVKRVDKSLSGLVNNLIGFTAPLAAGFGLAVKSALDFDSTMTNIGAVLGKNREEMAGLSAEIRAIGGASVQGPQAVADAFYDIVGGVSDASLHIPILNQAIALSTAGAADLGASTAALVATMNSYGFEADKASFVSDVFTQTVNKGVGTMDEFAAAFPSVTGMANSMGIELDKLGTYMAFMTTKGVTASEASTMLRGAMSSMLNPSKDLQKAIEALGYDTGEAMVKAEGLDGALALLKDYNGGTFAGLLTDQEALRAGLILTDDGLADFAVSFGETLDGVTARTEALQMESASNQFALLTSKISETGIKIGQVLLPVLIDLADKMMPVVEGVLDWVRQNPDLVQGIALLTLGAGALGVVLVPLGWIVSGLGTFLTIASGGATLLWGALGLILSPVGLLVTAIGGLLAILGSGEGGLVGGFMRAVHAAEQLVQLGIYVVLGALAELSNSPLFASIRGAFEGAFNAIKGIVESAAGFINGLLGGIAQTINDVLAGLGLINSSPIATGVPMAQPAPLPGNGLETRTKRSPVTTNGFTSNTGRALGGMALGRTLVGEDGPEVVDFGKPAMVFSNPSTRGGNNYGNRLMGGGGGVNINGTINVYGVQDVNALLDQLNTISARRSSQ